MLGGIVIGCCSGETLGRMGIIPAPNPGFPIVDKRVEGEKLGVKCRPWACGCEPWLPCWGLCCDISTRGACGSIAGLGGMAPCGNCIASIPFIDTCIIPHIMAASGDLSSIGGDNIAPGLGDIRTAHGDICQAAAIKPGPIIAMCVSGECVGWSGTGWYGMALGCSCLGWCE